MAGLATRGGAGVEHAHARPGIQQPGRQLRSGVLHRHQAICEPRQPADFDGAQQTQRLRRKRAVVRLQSRPRQRRAVVRHRRSPDIHPQPHRRMPVASLENRPEILGPILLERPYHPGGVRMARGRVAVRCRQDGFALPQESPQDGVDEPRGLRPAQQATGLDGLGHRRMRWRLAMDQLVQTHQGQRPDFRIETIRRPSRQPGQAALELVEPPHRAEREGLHGRLQRDRGRRLRQGILEAAPVASHRQYDARRQGAGLRRAIHGRRHDGGGLAVLATCR